jgi:Fe(3+) dicitrate transport protein
MSKRGIFLSLMILVLNVADAQTKKESNDTLHIRSLPDVTVVGRNSKSDYQQMPEIVGTNIYAGKKNALIVLDNVQGNVVTNNMRQVLQPVG